MNINGTNYFSRCLTLPTIQLCGGEKLIIIDSRGQAILGVFKGFASGFLALAPDCDNPANIFVNIKRVNKIIVGGRCDEVSNEDRKEHSDRA